MKSTSRANAPRLRIAARLGVLLAISLALSDCTLFFGAAHADPDRCAARCRAVGMRLAGIVYHGEFASSCACETRESSSGATIAAAARPAWRNVPVVLP